MKKKLLQLSLFATAMLLNGTATAQIAHVSPVLASPNGQHAAMPVHQVSRESVAGTFTPTRLIQEGKLPSVLTDLTGASKLPISTNYPLQSNGHALHNVQVDPDNPNNIHVVIMGTTNNTAADTTPTAAYSSRRCLYTFSKDGGSTWKTPVVFNATLKTGYPNMILFKRADGKYVPIIAAHHIIAPGSTDLNSAIYIEKGEPGDGNFLEVNADRMASNGATENLIWPSIAVSPDNSKVYMIASFSGPAGATLGNMELGTFSMSQDGKSATWDKWLNEPGAGDANFSTADWASGGGSQIRVSQSGTVGVFWQNVDVSTPDASLYLVQSNDGGKTWPTTMQTFFGPEPADPNIQNAQLSGSSAFDFWYNGEEPYVVFMADFQLFANNQYFPSTSSLFFFKPGQTATVDFLSKEFTNAQHTPDFQMSYPVGSQIDPQGPIVNYLTVGRTSDTNIFSVFYQSYASGDSTYVGDLGGGKSLFNYASIWYQTTLDGGLTFTEPRPLRDNSNVAPGAQKNDYRYPMVSDWNPLVAGQNATFVTAFEVDTAAGYVERGGEPGFGPQSFYVQKQVFSGVKQPKSYTSSLVLNQAYPNPFAAATTISFELKEMANVTVEISDMMGRPVTTLVNTRMAAGPHSVDFSAANLAAGTYTYTLKANGESVSRAMTVIK